MKTFFRWLWQRRPGRWRRQLDAKPPEEQARLKAIWHEQARLDSMEVW